MTEKRTVHVGINVSLDLPNTWRLYAECADEQTDVIFTGEPLFTLPTTEAELLSGGFAEVLLAEHAARCGACRRWAVA
jgi:hypothetical protein